MEPNVCAAQILIDAPIERVWAVMMDLAAYPEWNPFVVQVDVLDGAVEVGGRLRLHVSKQGSPATAGEEVRVVQPPRDGAAEFTYAFRGPVHALGLVRARREQRLVAVSPTQTRYETRERFTGLLWRAVPFKKLRPAFEAQAQALKARAEAAPAA